jgi:hypothetical protein
MRALIVVLREGPKGHGVRCIGSALSRAPSTLFETQIKFFSSDFSKSFGPGSYNAPTGTPGENKKRFLLHITLCTGCCRVPISICHPRPTVKILKRNKMSAKLN